ncbi:hypothetical protein TTHERM_00594180 (macronuclear) [Tetrahymena thermophila SB210]|uniref:Uncharacterized protein n=1 Tax=Tetrahymena thermophila (strain SB210) TaxID=312017 RepID=Q232H9_TETTS|nr:hypothetical protein TTHERM_00594180 [Tetrahymena thermophila SB210]EAR91433.1 hypothetical protein TTHERM_00594180 [Tetrahymena thermophila SB210]|eukprot:XP_001011678.1 hypothetical protein TTHERM_00594180 [Tetrahymena thermophila SB210]
MSNNNNYNYNQGRQPNFQQLPNGIQQNQYNFNQPNNQMFNQHNHFNFNQIQQQQQQFYRQVNYLQESQQSDIQSQILQNNNQNTNFQTREIVNTNNINAEQQINNQNQIYSQNRFNYNNSNNNDSNNQRNNYNYNDHSNNNNNYSNRNNDGNNQQLYHQFRNMNEFQQIKELPDWKDEYQNISYIEDICISIPTFVDSKKIQQLDSVLSEINKEIQQFLENKQDRKQIISQIKEKFITSSKIEFNSRNNIQSNQSLSFNDEETDIMSTDFTNYADFENKQESILRSYVTSTTEQIQNDDNQNYKSQLIDFIVNMFEQNKFQKSFFSEEFKNELNNNIQKQKINYLIDDSDFEQSTIDKIKSIKEIKQFGYDLCNQEENQIIYKEQNFKAVSFNFRKEKLLKTTMYCILKNFICSGSQAKSKKYLIKQLMHIDSKNKQLEVDYIILRQIYLRFFDLVVNYFDDNNKMAIEFLDNLFKYEFISSLLLDHYKRLIRFLSKKKLKENPKEILDQFVESYYLDLFIINSGSLKYRKKYSKSKKPYFLCFYTQSNIQQNELDQISIVQDIKKFQIQQ